MPLTIIKALRDYTVSLPNTLSSVSQVHPQESERGRLECPSTSSEVEVEYLRFSWSPLLSVTADKRLSALQSKIQHLDVTYRIPILQACWQGLGRLCALPGE